MKSEKKKSAPGGTPIPKQDYGTTSGSKSQWLAEILFDMIGKYDKPIKRPKNASVDRAFRRLISEANKNGDVIINDGAGYYRPKRGDGFDEHCYEICKKKELAKAWDIINKYKIMDESFYGGTDEHI